MKEIYNTQMNQELYINNKDPYILKFQLLI